MCNEERIFPASDLNVPGKISLLLGADFFNTDNAGRPLAHICQDLRPVRLQFCIINAII
jgi:hypothetical protein